MLVGTGAKAGPLHRRLSEGLAELIDRGELPPLALLPSERALAAALTMSRTTVVTAYQTLRDSGRLERRQGSGTRVAAGGGRATVSGSLLAGDHAAAPFLDGPLATIDFATAALPSLELVAEGAAGLSTDDYRRLTAGPPRLPPARAAGAARADRGVVHRARPADHGERGAGHLRRAAGARADRPRLPAAGRRGAGRGADLPRRAGDVRPGRLPDPLGAPRRHRGPRAGGRSPAGLPAAGNAQPDRRGTGRGPPAPAVPAGRGRRDGAGRRHLAGRHGVRRRAAAARARHRRPADHDRLDEQAVLGRPAAGLDPGRRRRWSPGWRRSAASPTSAPRWCRRRSACGCWTTSTPLPRSAASSSPPAWTR